MNSKRPIIFASPVNDLTIARYLSAMHTDYLGINLDHPDEQALKKLILQFKEWVEGPQLIGISALPIPSFQLEYDLDGYYSDSDLSFITDKLKFHSASYLKNHPKSVCDFMIAPGIEQCSETIPSLLKVNLNELQDLVFPAVGFLIQPGTELKPGLYDFDELDRWFEKWEEGE